MTTVSAEPTSAPVPAIGETPSHSVPFGTHGWRVWRDVLLRTTGFPVDRLDEFRSEAAASAVDDFLADRCGRDEIEQVLGTAVADSSRAAVGVASDALFREAVTWQNPGVLSTLDRLVREGPVADPGSRRRQREEVVARYWQRYCSKNETIGFFGPVCWGLIDDASGLVSVPGPHLTSRRRVFFEYWVLDAVAALLDTDPTALPLLVPRLHPHLGLDGGQVLRPAAAPAGLRAEEQRVLEHCDGRRSAGLVAAEVAADPTSGLRDADDVTLLLHRLRERGLLRWQADLPQTLDAELVLDHLLDGLPAGVGETAMRAWGDLCHRREQVAAAAGDPQQLASALSHLHDGFTALTGRAGGQHAGEAYGGRTLCHEETTRDLQVRIGADVVDSLTPVLEPLLQAARWLTQRLVEAYGGSLESLADELDDPCSLADVWFLAQGPLFGTGARPVDDVAEDFAARWAELVGLGDDSTTEARLELSADTFAERAAALFLAERPGWSAGRLHSPDLHLCARDAEAVDAGDFFWVLGEMHAAWATFDCSALTVMHDEPEALREYLRADLGGQRIHPLVPVGWPRYTGRVSQSLDGHDDVQLGFTEAPGADPERLLPVTSMRVERTTSGRIVVSPDGRRWPLVEAFSDLIAMHAVDAFKLVTDRPHTPRLTVGRVVVSRETWRTSTDALTWLGVQGLRDRFIEARGWRAECGFPERVFVKVAGETKPFYVDFSSPLLVSAMCVVLRSARSRHGSAAVVVSEMLPAPEHAWVADAAGARYLSELRLQLVDPVAAAEGAAR